MKIVKSKENGSRDGTKNGSAPLTAQLAPGGSRDRIADCCWPIGDPKKVNFHLCGKESEPGKPYCRKHADLAYVGPDELGEGKVRRKPR